MSPTLRLSSFALAASLLAVSLYAAEPAATAPASQPTTTRAPEDDFQKAVSENKITGDQLAKIEAKRNDFYDGLTALEENEIGLAAKAAREAIATAKKTKDPQAIAAAEAAAKTPLAAYAAKRTALRASVFSEFTLAQQKKFAGRWLFDASNRSVKKLELTPDQQLRRREICDQLAAAYLTENMMVADPYLWKFLETQSPLMRDQLRKSVLTPEQAAIYDADLAAAATQKAAPATMPKP